MPVPGLSLLGLKCIKEGFVSILRYINPTIIIIIILYMQYIIYLIIIYNSEVKVMYARK